MSNLITRLINTGLVTKRQDTLDARAMLVKLTPKGLKQIDEAMVIQAACERKLTQALSPSERKQLAVLLKKMQVEDY